MKLSTLILIIIGVLAGAWLLNLIYHFSAWLSGLMTYVIAGLITAGLIWLFIQFRQHNTKSSDHKSDDK